MRDQGGADEYAATQARVMEAAKRLRERIAAETRHVSDQLSDDERPRGALHRACPVSQEGPRPDTPQKGPGCLRGAMAMTIIMGGLIVAALSTRVASWPVQVLAVVTGFVLAAVGNVLVGSDSPGDEL